MYTEGQVWCRGKKQFNTINFLAHSSFIRSIKMIKIHFLYIFTVFMYVFNKLLNNFPFDYIEIKLLKW